jgi:hypothetical protein
VVEYLPSKLEFKYQYCKKRFKNIFKFSERTNRRINPGNKIIKVTKWPPGGRKRRSWNHHTGTQQEKKGRNPVSGMPTRCQKCV